MSALDPAVPLPAEAQALRNRCFHPGGSFVPFSHEAIEQSVGARFEAMVRRHPGRVAVRTPARSLTYDALNRAVNRIARAILAVGVPASAPVAVIVEHGVDAVVAMLAVLKAGRIYVPIDPAAASAHGAHVLEDTEAALVLTHGREWSRAAALAGARALLDIDEIGPDAEDADPELTVPPSALAYVLYTSGSAGPAKGVVQEHKSLLHQVKRETNSLHVCVDDRLILLRSTAAIGGVRVALGALLNGASVHPLRLAPGAHHELVDTLARDGITIYDSTPTTFRHFAAGLAGESFPDLRLIRLSSEPASSRDVDLYRRHFHPPCILVNSLGLTEVGGSARHYFVDAETRVPEGTLPVGHAVEGVDVLLVDAEGREIATGSVGEIAVRSRYLPPGYWRRPDLTSARYRPDPGGGDARVYRTGDVGRMLPDGCLLHLGRRDARVKVRGSFVDLAEVERRLLTLDVVKEAVVVAREAAPDEQRLVAYLVSDRTPAPTASALRRALAGALPDHMIPAAFVTLPALPLTPTGKVDRGALLAPGRERPDLDTAFVPPSTPLEHAVAGIWADALALDRVGIHDDFFEIGGHSLLAMRVVEEVRRRGPAGIPLESLLQCSTVAAMAEGLVRALESLPADAAEPPGGSASG
jgi:amino acid adenylation domain-containing protein